MEFQLLSPIPVFKSSTHSSMCIFKDQTVREHAALITRAKSLGYTEIFKNRENEAMLTSVYKKDTEIVTVCRNSATNEIRVFWEDEKYNSVEPMTKPETVGDGETTLTQIGVGAYGKCDDDPMIGMNYLIKNSDGQAIILDGGVFEENADDIYKALELHNIAKDEEGRFIIASWILTHAHGDHIGAFRQFAKKYKESATVEYVMYNFPGENRMAGWSDFSAFENDIDENYPDVKRVTPRLGQKYYFGNVCMNMLCSPDMLYREDKALNYFNDTSIAFTLEAEGVRALFLGDGGDAVAAKILQCIRTDRIKSHFVQITHHGLYTANFVTSYNAEESSLLTASERHARMPECHINENLTKLYETAAPAVGLWPMGDTLGQPRNGRTTVMRDWSRMFGQTAYFVDTEAEDSGYNGINEVRKGDLITYTMSSEDMLMITKFALKDGEVTLLANQTYLSYIEENQ